MCGSMLVRHLLVDDIVRDVDAVHSGDAVHDLARDQQFEPGRIFGESMRQGKTRAPAENGPSTPPERGTTTILLPLLHRNFFTAPPTPEDILMKNVHLALRVNGEAIELAVAPNKTLLEILREDLRLSGTKHGCELGECGACAVLVDGKPMLSCLLLALECDGTDVVTVEGLSNDARLNPLQEAFADCGATQCGYCTPGFLITAKALLDERPAATREEIAEALSGNLCRCTGYVQIFEAVESAAKKMERR
jgi:aerobic-type carbon monoxide dehydrogenase small subunit (CoxS/CutS family)